MSKGVKIKIFLLVRSSCFVTQNEHLNECSIVDVVFYSAFITQLQIQIENIDAEALKQQNREIRREIFGL